ncbi:MAG: pinensin family lanthipeptide [Bacteroidota bacterium]
MKKKKLSLKGLEVKSFVTNLDANLSHTVKGGNTVDNDCGGSGLLGCGGDSEYCSGGFTQCVEHTTCCEIKSEDLDCRERTYHPACDTGHTYGGGFG